VESNDYYPFGLTFNSYSRENTVPNQFNFNGKEEQDELNLGWLDYGFRMYMPDLGRWGVIDPLSEIYNQWSPYNYALNNPIRLIDPNGMAVTETDSSYVLTGDDARNFWHVATRPKTHEVKKGDTFYGIANRGFHNTFTVDDLINWNPGVDFNNLQIGQRINVSSEEDRKMDEIVRFIAKQIAGNGVSSNDPLVLQVIWESLDGKINPNDIQFDENHNIQGWGIIGEVVGPVAQKEFGKWLGKKLVAAGTSATVTNLAVGAAKHGFGVAFSTVFMLLDATDAGSGSSHTEQRQIRATKIMNALNNYFETSSR
jgi:RHS repeat-associated protein